MNSTDKASILNKFYINIHGSLTHSESNYLKDAIQWLSNKDDILMELRELREQNTRNVKAYEKALEILTTYKPPQTENGRKQQIKQSMQTAIRELNNKRSL